MRFARPVLLLALAGLLSTGCGVAFRDAPQGNEFFSRLEVTGDKHVGQPLTAAVAFKQFYPVDVFIRCEVLQDDELVKPIGDELIQAYPQGNPDVTPFPGNYSFDFTMEAPGDYAVECYTPRDEDNFIGEGFTIAPAVETTSLPAPTSGDDGG